MLSFKGCARILHLLKHCGLTLFENAMEGTNLFKWGYSNLFSGLVEGGWHKCLLHQQALRLRLWSSTLTLRSSQPNVRWFLLSGSVGGWQLDRSLRGIQESRKATVSRPSRWRCSLKWVKSDAPQYSKHFLKFYTDWQNVMKHFLRTVISWFLIQDDANNDPQWSEEQLLEAKFCLAGLTIGQCEVDIMNRSTVAIFEILEKAWATQNCTLVDMKVRTALCWL